MITLNEDLVNLLAEFINDSGLQRYLIYGSYAFSYFTKTLLPISDIDIIASKENFTSVADNISKFPDKWKSYISAKSIHVNSQKLVGNDGKLFDISLDSYEDYFENKGFALDDFIVAQLNCYNLKLVSPPVLLNIYRQTYKGHYKEVEYLAKITTLENLVNNTNTAV